jgi:hypothetical protein
VDLSSLPSSLPGAELILSGLEDLKQGQSLSIGALLVAIAATRLSQAGLVVAREHLAKEPELALYDRLQDEQEDPYGYYNALLKRLDSFCNALESLVLAD